jgi:hypothetical protein
MRVLKVIFGIANSDQMFKMATHLKGIEPLHFKVKKFIELAISKY